MEKDLIQVGPQSNRCVVTGLYSRDREKKFFVFFLDADVLETANLSYNLAKAMPTAVDAKLEWEKGDFSKIKSTWNSKTNKTEIGRLSTLKPTIKIGLSPSFFMDVECQHS